MAASGLADLALYEGRITEAAALLDRALHAEADGTRRLRLQLTLAEARVTQGRGRDANVLAEGVRASTTDPGLMFLAGRVFALTGAAAPALEIAATLDQRLDSESQIYGRLLAGEVALQRKELRRALENFQAAQAITDTWLGRFGLGRAYLAGDAFAEADSEFDACMQRRGEATAVLLDDVPTARLVAPVHYYQGVVAEGLGSPRAAESFKAFLAIKARGDEGGLVADARRRAGTP
jgi:hypothetical protein